MRVLLIIAISMELANCFFLRMPIERFPLTQGKNKIALPRVSLGHEEAISPPSMYEHDDLVDSMGSADSDLFAQEAFESWRSMPKSTLSSIQSCKSATAPHPLTAHQKVDDSLRKLQSLLLREELFDAQLIARLQVRLLTNMMKSDIQNRNDDVNVLHKLPMTYLKALRWMNEIFLEFNRNQGGAASTVSLLKLLLKKEGLSPLVKKVENNENVTRSAREIVEIKRSVERSLSEMITVISGTRQCAKFCGHLDFFFFAKPLIKKCNMHERHYALLVLTRGILAPTYRSKKSWPNENIDVSMIMLAPFESPMKTFKEGMAIFGQNHPSSAARMVFPFLLAAMRCHDATTTVKLSMLTGGIQQIIADNENKRAGLDTAALKVCAFLSLCIDYDLDSASQNGVVGFGEDLLVSLRRWLTDVSALSIINSDTKKNDNIITSFPEEIRKNTVAMELLLTDKTFCEGKRRARETFVLQFAEVGRFVDIVISGMVNSTIEGKKGTPNMKIKYGKMNMITCMKVTMSVYSTYQWLPRSNRLRKKIEKYFELKDISLGLIPKKISFAKNVQVTSQYKRSDKEGINNLMLGETDDSLFSSSLSSAPRYKDKSFLQNLDESLWESEASASNMHTKRFHKGGKFSMNKVPTFADANPRQLMRQLSRYLRELICELLVDSTTQGRTLMAELAHSNPKFKEEVIYIYATWRRPHLLLDYYRMHSSSPELLRIYSRWLKALMALTDETVDDIRRKDPKNKRHYQLIPSNLVESWIEGKIRVTNVDEVTNVSKELNKSRYSPFIYKTESNKNPNNDKLGASLFQISDILMRSIGNNRKILDSDHKNCEKTYFEYLPGYNDPQTFFMMGEDVNSCMSIRARQKGTNRGLISFLVHGNNRILGTKDSSGKCIARAVARLLIDNVTGFPVIYLDAPYGDIYDASNKVPKDVLLDIYDQAAKLGRLMQLPVIYSTPPPESDYYSMGPLEMLAIYEGKQNITNLIDHSLLATHQWVEGLKFPGVDIYDNDFLPKLIRLEEHHAYTGVALGFRSPGYLERIDIGRKYENILEKFKTEMELEAETRSSSPMKDEKKRRGTSSNNSDGYSDDGTKSAMNFDCSVDSNDKIMEIDRITGGINTLNDHIQLAYAERSGFPPQSYTDVPKDSTQSNVFERFTCGENTIPYKDDVIFVDGSGVNDTNRWSDGPDAGHRKVVGELLPEDEDDDLFC